MDGRGSRDSFGRVDFLRTKFMDMLGTNQEHLESIKSRWLEKGFNLSPEDVNGVIGIMS